MKCPRCEYENPDGTRYCGQCGRELAGTGRGTASDTKTYRTPTRGLERGTTFARRFEIIEEIGQGGMGTVYKAFDNKIKEVVALKLLKPEIASDLEVIERFRNEIKLARKVAHRHVCRMYDISEEGLVIYISMEYVHGEDLKSFIRRSGHLNEAKALDLSRQICEGLAEAHRMGVVHRDLKPQNIMIDRDGNAKVMDFGIARSLHTRGITGTGVIIGTPEYMAPEQADARDVDLRADVYAFGVILYEMVTGRVPFEGETPLSIVLKHKSEPPVDPKALNAQISAGLSQVILRCLEKPRERRYQNMSEILEDLARIEKGLPTTQKVAIRRKPITSKEITVKFSVKKILVPAVALVAVIVAGVFLIGRGPKGRRADERFPGGTISIPVPPGIKTGVATPSEHRSDSPQRSAGRGTESAKILSFIAPLFKDPSKYMGEKEAQEVERALAAIKEKFPAEAAAFSGLLDNIQTRIEEGKKLEAAGNVEASRKSFGKGESEMRKLLAQVSERDRAEKAHQDMLETKKRVAESPRRDEPNLLSWIAAEKEKDASDAYRKSDFSGARILYGILNKIFLLSLQGGDEEQCLSALQGYVAAIRMESEAAQAPAKEAWLYGQATEDEASAQELTGQKQYAQAAEQYILAAFLFEKAKEVAQESTQAGRR